MKKRDVIGLIICFLLVVCGGFLMFNSIFFKSLFHKNQFDSGKDPGTVVSELIHDHNGYSMIITGKGEMSDFIPPEWSKSLYNESSGWKISIQSASIENGVTSISSCLFMGCSKLKKVQLSQSIRVIGVKAFAYCENLDSIIYTGTMQDWNCIMENSPLWNDESQIRTVICSDGEISIK